MTEVTYEVVEHDGGWAYKVGDVFSETFRSHDDARDAAQRSAAEQTRPGDAGAIEFQDASGRWHVEDAKGDDRPNTDVSDTHGALDT